MSNGGQGSPPKRVLVLDDDPQWCEMLREIFGSRGIVVEESHTGNDCIELAKSKQYDLIVIDVILANDPTAGIGVAKQLNDDPTTRNVPKLFLTIVGADVVEKEAANRTIEVFQKPLELTRLLQRAQQLLGVTRQ
jgi:CheY-like chemotaxis protein